MIFAPKKQRAPLHFRRIELKYILPDSIVPIFVRKILPYTQPDPFLVEERKGRRSYPVSSLYFDSIDLHSIYEKEAGLLSRRKVRLRTYAEDFSDYECSFLEIKRRHDFIVSKDRLSISVNFIKEDIWMPHLLSTLLKRIEADEDVTHEAHVLHNWYNLQPTTLVRYHRTPFVGMQDRRFRITIDSDLNAVWKPMSLKDSLLFTSCNPGFSVLEIKSNHALPAWFHDILQDFQLSRIAHSKYAICTRILRDNLCCEGNMPYT
ncbi:MAG: polyphosphate polymerase domain-containing protein [Candidatus Peribacteraceae bacterium]|nr:polyphosphate polymerase domain-containing protein [Candidatus Peribacteraceae bacterium]